MRSQEDLERFCADLRDLHRVAGQPSLAVLRRSMPGNPGTSTLSDLMAGKTRRPPRWELVSEFVVACNAYAVRCGRDLPAGMANLPEWRRRHDDLVRIVDAVQRAERASRATTEPSPSRWLPVAEWNPIDLGVHRAIDLSQGMDSFDVALTPYVSRPHDQEFRQLLARLKLPASIFVVGESSTGKTRCGVEAIRSCVPELPIAYPANSKDLCGILDHAAESDSFILWLDEAQRYLDGDWASEAAMQLTRIMLDKSRPLLVVGTMWADRWFDLTAHPVSGPDHTASIRRYLSLSNVTRIFVPANFSEASVGELDAAARNDPRLSLALRSAGSERGMTQVLAGGVQLIDRYKVTLDSYSRAVLTAAMDCSRLGYDSPLPYELLISSVAGYLTPRERVVGQETMNLAFERATQLVNGIGALDPVRVEPGLGKPEGYVLHDYLHYFALEERRIAPVPGATWAALDKYASDFGDRVRLSWQAVFRHYERLAVRFLEKVVEAEHAAQDCLRLVWILERAGHSPRAEAILKRAAEAGDNSSMRELASRLLRTGDHRSAEDLLRKAANLKDTEAMLMLASSASFPMLSWTEAEYWLNRAAEEGNILAMRKVAAMRAYSAPAEALEYLRRGAETGEGNIMLDLIMLLEEVGEEEESRDWIEQLVSLKLLHMVAPLTEWLEGEGRVGEAEACLRKAMATGEMTIAMLLSELLERIEGSSAAVAVWHEVIESRRLSGMSYIVAKKVVGQIERAGERASAAEWLRNAASNNCPHSALILVELTGPDDKEDLLRKAIQHGNFWAMPQLVNVLELENRAREAESLLRETVEAAPYFDAWRMLTTLVEHMGRADEAEAMVRFGIEPGGQTAAPW